MLIATRLRRVLLSAFIPVLLIVGKIIIDRPYVRDDEFFLLIFLFYIGTYIFLGVLFFALSEKHKGWKRLSLVLGPIGAIPGGYIGFFATRDVIPALLGAYIGLLVGLSVIAIFRWIARGFKDEQQ